MKQSNFLSLGWRDGARAFLVAFIAFVFEYLQKTFIPSLDLSDDVKLMIITALAYLSKNFFTPKDKNLNSIDIGVPIPPKKNNE